MIREVSVTSRIKNRDQLFDFFWQSIESTFSSIDSWADLIDLLAGEHTHKYVIEHHSLPQLQEDDLAEYLEIINRINRAADDKCNKCDITAVWVECLIPEVYAILTKNAKKRLSDIGLPCRHCSYHIRHEDGRPVELMIQFPSGTFSFTSYSNSIKVEHYTDPVIRKGGTLWRRLNTPERTLCSIDVDNEHVNLHFLRFDLVCRCVGDKLRIEKYKSR